MSTTAILRACEASTVEAAFAAPVPCGEPGHWWTSPSGKSYVLCEHHVQVFSQSLISRALDS